MEGGDRQQGGDRHAVLVDVPVAQDQDIAAALIGPVHLQAEPVDRLFQGGVLIVGDRDLLHLKARLFHVLDL